MFVKLDRPFSFILLPGFREGNLVPKNGMYELTDTAKRFKQILSPKKAQMIIDAVAVKVVPVPAAMPEPEPEPESEIVQPPGIKPFRKQKHGKKKWDIV